MTWPQATDYNAAVQNPQLCFRDDDLRQGQVAGDLFGLPRPHSGNFADVYQIQAADHPGWAVKCFTRPVAGLHRRYQAISDHLRQTQLAFMVEFHYLEEGICVQGRCFPILKMRWVEGLRLNEFIREHLDKPVVLDRLAHLWVRLGQELRDAEMAHGDLQHGNVLLVPGSKSSMLALKLIDYDGMVVPALADAPSGEVGHPNYQHPQRLRDGTYHREVDRFSHLLIYTALRCLRVGGVEMWDRHDNLENLLFREEDFRRPGNSMLLRELWGLKEREARDLVGHLVLASQGPLLVVPSLDELLEADGIRPLTAGEEAQVNALLGESPPAGKSRTVAPAQTVPPAPTVRVVEVEPAPVAVLDARPTGEMAAETAQMPRLDPTTPELSRMPARSKRRAASSEEVPQEAPPSPDLTPPPGLDVGRLLDPVVSFLSRPAWLAALGGTALLSFLLVNVLVWSLARPGTTTSRAVVPPRLQPVADVTLKGGHKQEIVLQVERNDFAGPLMVELEGLPREIKAPVLTVHAEQDTVTLPLVAPLDFGMPPRAVTVSLWEGGRRLDEQSFQLSVRKVPAPVLRQPEQIHGQAGTSLVFTADVERNGCQEPLRVEFEGLPRGVKQESLPGAAGDPPRVRLRVAADAPPQVLVPATLLLRVGDVVAASRPLLISVREAAAGAPAVVKATGRVHLRKEKVPETLSVRAGEWEELLVGIERGGYQGPVELRLDGVPEGVTARPATVRADATSATLAVSAAATASVGRSTVKLVARDDNETVDEQEMVLEVEKPAALSSENPGGQPERVIFHTVDQVQIVGTLYPGSKGKHGACVLMLHELGEHRRIRAWERLAESLQAEGHTVLTFDFRGHGESKHVTAEFWKAPVNRALPVFQQGKWEDGLPETIKAADLPGAYMPWMIHDIAAARMFLDLRQEHPSSAVNTANLMVFGVGRGASLGALWLASEGIRYDATGSGDKIKLIGLKNRDIIRAVWLGIETKWKDHEFPVGKWVHWAHQLYPDSMVPMEFLYGAEDAEGRRTADQLIAGKNGVAKPIPGASLSGMMLLEKDRVSRREIRNYLAKILDQYDYKAWAPRGVQGRRSYWGFPTPKGQIDFYLARRPGELILHPVPLRGFGIRMAGLPEPRPVVPGKTD